MLHNLIEIRAKLLKEQDEYLIHVAVETGEGQWRGYVRRCNRFDLAAAQLTAKTGKKLSRTAAEKVFPEVAENMVFENKN
jgi:hypothetical protein